MEEPSCEKGIERIFLQAMAFPEIPKSTSGELFEQGEAPAQQLRRFPAGTFSKYSYFSECGNTRLFF